MSDPNSCYIRSSQTSTNVGLDALSDKVDQWGFKFHQELMAFQAKTAVEANDKARGLTRSPQTISC